MSDLFIIGASGTKAYRTAMAAISENITNASTEGFTRRSVTTVESGSSTATMALYISRGNFGGTDVSSVNRATDPYLDASVRMTTMNLNSANSRMRWMREVETALNDGNTGVGKLMSNMFGNIDKLAASPSDTSLRVTTLDSIARVADTFRETANGLNTISTGITTEAQSAVASANRALSNLADINNSLLRAQPNTSAYAQLLDSRDAALQSLSGTLNVSVSFGTHDSVQISFDGQTLVSGNAATPLALTANADGSLALDVNGATVAAPASGTLGGLFASADVVVDRRSALDDLAQQFVTDVNAWHAQGLTDPDPVSGAQSNGAPLLAYNGGAAAIAALTIDPSELAVRSTSGTLNGNLLNATSMRGTGSVEAGWTALIAGQANLLTTVKSEQATAQSRNDQSVAAREAVSGVDLDMEAADLLRIQQAYSGCAKILQVARETVDAILKLI